MGKKKVILLSILSVLGLLFFAVMVNPFLLLYPLFASGYYEDHQSRIPLKDAHQRAVKTFVESKGFGRFRFRRAGLWNAYSISYNDRIYETETIRLIGLTPEFGERLFPFRYPPKKNDIPDVESRVLTTEESNAIKRLRAGEVEQVELPPENATDLDSLQVPGSVRVLAPIISTKDCLKCHDGEVGEVLGAFDYFLDPVDW